MAANDEMRRSLIYKVGGLVLIILGFLLAAAGYRYGQAWYIGAGLVALVVGIVLMVRKIAGRNEGSQP